jgi:hypothetical protein
MQPVPAEAKHIWAGNQEIKTCWQRRVTRFPFFHTEAAMYVRDTVPRKAGSAAVSLQYTYRDNSLQNNY